MMLQETVFPLALLLVAAPGEPPVALRDIPDVAKMAVMRRLERGSALTFGRITVKPSQYMPGYVVCGEFSEHNSRMRPTTERFFVIVPGSFATLERDGEGLLDKYWNINGC